MIHQIATIKFIVIFPNILRVLKLFEARMKNLKSYTVH